MPTPLPTRIPLPPDGVGGSLSPAKGNTMSEPANCVEVRVCGCKLNQVWFVRFLGNLRGMDTHYDGSRGSMPCLGAESCPVTKHRLRTIWKGYAAAQWWDQSRQLWIPCVWEATEAFELQTRGFDLVGTVWQLSRLTGKSGGSPVMGKLLSRGADVPEAFDIRPTLCRLYHTLEFPLDVPNRVPDKTVAPVSAGESPIQLAVPQEPERVFISDEDRKRLKAAWDATVGKK